MADNPSCSNNASDITNNGKASIGPVKGKGNANKIDKINITTAINARNKYRVKKLNRGFKSFSARPKIGRQYLITFAKSVRANDLFSKKPGNQGFFAPTKICSDNKVMGIPRTADMPGKNIGVRLGKVNTRIKIPKPRSPRITSKSPSDMRSRVLSSAKLTSISEIRCLSGVVIRNRNRFYHLNLHAIIILLFVLLQSFS